jgi:hypothetical protein
MVSTRKLAGTLTLGLLAIALSACCATAGQTPPSPPPPPPARDDCTGITNHNIEIGVRVSCKWVFVKSNDTGNGNTINWRSTVSGRKVKIVFDNLAVFPDLRCKGDQDVCQSGALNKELHGDPSVDFKYHAYLCEDSDHCSQEVDPGIIIVP